MRRILLACLLCGCLTAPDRMTAQDDEGVVAPDLRLEAGAEADTGAPDVPVEASEPEPAPEPGLDSQEGLEGQEEAQEGDDGPDAPVLVCTPSSLCCDGNELRACAEDGKSSLTREKCEGVCDPAPAGCPAEDMGCLDEPPFAADCRGCLYGAWRARQATDFGYPCAVLLIEDCTVNGVWHHTGAAWSGCEHPSTATCKDVGGGKIGLVVKWNTGEYVGTVETECTRCNGPTQGEEAGCSP